MRYDCSALPWELLGPRPVLITLTFPAEWRKWCVDARQLRRQREAFKEAWRRKFGAPVGIYVVEFQPRLRRPEAERQAPHVHLYIGLPNAVSDEEHAGYVARLLRRKRLEDKHGKYQGRALTREPKGEFADWVLATWWRIVGSGDKHHRRRGVDIMPAFYSERAEQQMNRATMADYFWKESGKFEQKTPPGDFGGLAFYGRWGGKVGFVPMEGSRGLTDDAYFRLRRVYRRLIEQQRGKEAATRGTKFRAYRGPRGRDGLTLFAKSAPELAGRLHAWANGEALVPLALRGKRPAEMRQGASEASEREFCPRGNQR